MGFTFDHPYQYATGYQTPVAYFCMEYAIHQPLKLWWLTLMKNSMQDVIPGFDSNRMAAEYYEKMYTLTYQISTRSSFFHRN